MEAFRVLKPSANSSACFTIWGKKSECLLFTLVETALEKYLTTEEKQKMVEARSNFDLYND